MNPRFFLIVVMLLLWSGRSGLLADERFAGEWKMTFSSIDVKLKSWGKFCGPEPKSYATNEDRDVEITSDGKHLFFSLGGVRTDRCWSPNPLLKAISESIEPGIWKRTCKTSPHDPNYEYGEYSLSASDVDHLNYFAVTDVDWTLKGNHCLARLEEKRTYLRNKQALGEKKSMQKGAADSRVEYGCEKHGPLERLAIQPHRWKISFKERVCFKAVGIDSTGCRFPVDLVWTVAKSGKDLSELISNDGCFSAGETAADAEGAYAITAQAEGKTASTELFVFVNYMEEFSRARLYHPVLPPKPEARPIDDSTPNSSAGEESDSEAKVGSAAVSVLPVIQRSNNSFTLALIIGFAALACSVLLLLLIVRYKNAKSTGKGDRESGVIEMVCPECNSRFAEDARFCPYDGKALASHRTHESKNPAKRAKPK